MLRVCTVQSRDHCIGGTPRLRLPARPTLIPTRVEPVPDTLVPEHSNRRPRP